MTQSVPLLHALIGAGGAFLLGVVLVLVWQSRALRKYREEIVRLQTRLDEEQQQTLKKLPTMYWTKSRGVLQKPAGWVWRRFCDPCRKKSRVLRRKWMMSTAVKHVNVFPWKKK